MTYLLKSKLVFLYICFVFETIQISTNVVNVRFMLIRNYNFNSVISVNVFRTKVFY